jgi:hypothetical protein
VRRHIARSTVMTGLGPVIHVCAYSGNERRSCQGQAVA